jgi:hypothetical protein
LANLEFASHKDRMRRGCVLLVLFFGLVTALEAQTTDTCSIYGLIVDPNHAAVPGASVIVTNSLMGLNWTTTTDSAGRFAIAGLPVAGEYEIPLQCRVSPKRAQINSSWAPELRRAWFSNSK